MNEKITARGPTPKTLAEATLAFEAAVLARSGSTPKPKSGPTPFEETLAEKWRSVEILEVRKNSGKVVCRDLLGRRVAVRVMAPLKRRNDGWDPSALFLPKPGMEQTHTEAVAFLAAHRRSIFKGLKYYRPETGVPFMCRELVKKFYDENLGLYVEVL